MYEAIPSAFTERWANLHPQEQIKDFAQEELAEAYKHVFTGTREGRLVLLDLMMNYGDIPATIELNPNQLFMRLGSKGVIDGILKAVNVPNTSFSTMKEVTNYLDEGVINYDDGRN
jgi:hypothetical protein